MTQVERVAEKLYNAALPAATKVYGSGIVPWGLASKDVKPMWLALARYHLRELRKARGRTVARGVLRYDDECDRSVFDTSGQHPARHRVVLIPRKKARR